jgi:Mn2+/Fe2+ NRAMP family transporter
VKKLGAIALGIVAAIGGFVDIGELVFNTQAGARVGYVVLWVIPVGVLGIIVFSEMSGRVAAIAGRANFDLVREYYGGRRLGVVTLVASLLLNVLMLCAELGGVGIALNLLFDVTPQLFMLLGMLGLALAAWLLPFEGIERVFGYGGLALLVFVTAAGHEHPDWDAVGQGLVPQASSSTLYWYFAVGMLAAAFMPYEIYMYSSGAIEEGWGEEHLFENRANAIVGFTLGGVLSAALVVVAAQVLKPQSIDPDSIGAVVLTAQYSYGALGLTLALVGIVFAVGGAAIDTCFSAAYNLAQYRGWPWGKNKGPRGAPAWHVSVAALFVGGYAIIATGLDPVRVTEYAVVLSAIAVPFTYLPVLRAASDTELMGKHASGPVGKALGWIYFVIVCVVAAAAPVLLVATSAGSG